MAERVEIEMFRIPNEMYDVEVDGLTMGVDVILKPNGKVEQAVQNLWKEKNVIML